MNKLLFFFIFYLFGLSSLVSDSFNELYLDLVNYWRLDRHSVFIDDLSSLGIPYSTGNRLNFFILDFGFFLLYDEINSDYYLTRNGNFSQDYRGFLINEDGYYILSINNQCINVDDINFDAADFSDIFLLVIPDVGANTYRTDKYIITSDYRCVTGIRILNNLLEAMPFSLDSLLDKAMLEVDTNRDFEDKEALIEILYQRYFELIDFRMIMPDEYYINLLNRIETFEEVINN